MENQLNRILVIEDNIDVLESIISILEYSGYPSKGITRFDEDTIEILKSEHINLIILDVMLSGHDGRDLIKKFKNRPDTKDIPVIMISAYPDMESSAKMAGADGFIQKPFGIDELMDNVEKYTKNGISNTSGS